MKTKSYEIVTGLLLEMQDCIDRKDREGFRALMTPENKAKLNNCSCGDSLLQGKIQGVYADALQTFLK